MNNTLPEVLTIPYGLRWAYAKAEGWTIIRIFNNGATDLIRLVEFCPVVRPWLALSPDLPAPRDVFEPTPDLIPFKDWPKRFEFIADEVLEPPNIQIEADLERLLDYRISQAV